MENGHNYYLRPSLGDLSAEHQNRMTAVTLSEAAHVYGLPLPYTAVFSPLLCATRTGSAIFNAGDPCFVSSKITFKFSVIDVASWTTFTERSAKTQAQGTVQTRWPELALVPHRTVMMLHCMRTTRESRIPFNRIRLAPV